MGDGVVQRALACLGKGFDFSSDFRLKYCKGEERLIHFNHTDTRQLRVPGFGSFDDVSVHIKCEKGERTRHQFDIVDFNQMSEIFNQTSWVPGSVPSGVFNAMFGFQSESWEKNAAEIKGLGLDGCLIRLFTLSIDRYPLVLTREVIEAVPSTWDPPALARFIEKYGTHLIVGLSMGGMDVVLIKQDKSSNMKPSQLKSYLNDLADQLFTGACTFSPHQCQAKEHKYKAFNAPNPQSGLLDHNPDITVVFDRITVLRSRRGGDPSVGSHHDWLRTVPSNPEAFHFVFVPISSLLKGVPGTVFLSHAINLYLRYKPRVAELQYFLDFQAYKLWAPIHSDLPLGPKIKKASNSPALKFYLLGPKLYVNTTQVTVGSTPVTGMRLYLEGPKCDRLGVHLQCLATPSVLFQGKLQDSPTWRGSEEMPSRDRYLEAVHWKRFSHICTAPVKYDPKWTTLGSSDTVFIVTGAQLHVKKHCSIRVLHLRLSYSGVSGSYVVQSEWMEPDSHKSCGKSAFFSSISTLIGGHEKEKPASQAIVESEVFPAGPPVPVRKRSPLKFVDTSQMCRGPSDSPGYWLVTGAKLDLEKGKVRLRVEFSLLNLCS